MDLVNVKTVVSTGTRIQPKTNGQRKRTLGSYHIYFPYSYSGRSRLSCSQFALLEGSAYRRQILLKNVLSYFKASPLYGANLIFASPQNNCFPTNKLKIPLS